MAVIELTRKEADFLVGRESHYAPQQLWYAPATKGGILADLVHVMEALNTVEDWLGISRTTWSSTMGNPLQTNRVHYWVRVGGDVNNLQTLREAIDRLRLAGEVDAWTWYFAPSVSDLRTGKCQNMRRLAYSNLVNFEYLLAIGRIVGGGFGGLAQNVITVSHHPYAWLVDAAAYGAYYQLNGGGRFSFMGPGERTNLNVFDFTNFWQTGGRLSREYWLSRQPTTPIEDPEESPNVHSTYTLFQPGLRNPTEEDLEQTGFSTTLANALLTMPIYMQTDEGDLSEDLEAIETAHQDLWEYVDREGSAGSSGLEISEIESAVDTSYIAGVVNRQGTAKYKDYYNPGPPSEIEFTYFGEFEMITTTSGMEDPPAVVDEPATGFDLDEAWGNVTRLSQDILGRGPGYVNLNSPVWEHNEANRSKVANTTFPEPAPKYFHTQRLNSDYRVEGTHVGSGAWRTSNVSPFTGTGYPYDSDDPEDEKTTEEVLEILLSRLRGIAGDGGGPGGSAVFDPTTQSPQKYFWCFPSFPFASEDGAIPDLATVFRPNAGDEYDGVPLQCRTAWRSALNTPGWDGFKDTLSAGESNFAQAYQAHCLAEGYVKADRTADLTVPEGTGGRGRWLCWMSPGSNGASPFEEISPRWDEERV